MINPNKNEANEQTNFNLEQAISAQLKRIYANINTAISKKQFSIIFYEDLYTENRTTLQENGFNTTHIAERGGEDYYSISWK